MHPTTIPATSPSLPALSIVLVTAERSESIRTTLRHLRAQTIRDRLEILLVGPDEKTFADMRAQETEGFFRVVTIATGPIDNVDVAAGAGIRRARAGIVAMVEDHAYPDPGWAEAILKAHEGPWAVVGSTFRNANPDSLLSWANLLLSYGHWTEPVERGETTFVSRHNISFKKEALTAFGDDLDRRLGRDGNLLGDLVAKGAKFYLEPDACVYHVNPSTLSSTIQLRFNAGRLYGAKRAAREHWSLARRAFYLACWPLVPLAGFARKHREYFSGGRRRELLPRAYFALMISLPIDGLGQAIGSAFGPGRAVDTLAAFEFERARHLNSRDRNFLGDNEMLLGLQSTT